MKTVTEQKADSKNEIETKRLNQRVYYFEKVKGLSHADAVMRAQQSKSQTHTKIVRAEGELSPWKQRELARKKGQPQPLKLPYCPKCEAEFFVKKNGKVEKSLLSTCSECGVRYYFCE